MQAWCITKKLSRKYHTESEHLTIDRVFIGLNES